MPTIYIDCSSTYRNPINTGIQRVVRNIARHASAAAAHHGYNMRLVASRHGEFSEIPLEQFLPQDTGAIWQPSTRRRLLLPLLSSVERLRNRLASLSPSPKWKDFVNAPRYRFGLAQCVVYPFSLPLVLVRHVRKKNTGGEPARMWAPTSDLSSDILLLADSTWDVADIWPAASRFRQQGGYVAAVIYDLIPLSHPQFFQPSVVSAFTKWLNKSTAYVDFYTCISSSTETALRAFLHDARESGQSTYFHLGSDLDLIPDEGMPSDKVKRIVAGGEPVFLAVGSLEPRKNLAFVLDAFERVWLRDSRVKLVLVGHNTWKVEALIERIEHHHLLDASLFWVRDASDTDLEYLYQNATALVFASIIEGFGLPVVEAMQRGLPVLCSDLPVLRELADGKAHFFGLESGDELVAAVTTSAAAMRQAGTPPRMIHEWMNWRESCDQLLAKVTAAHRDRLEQGE
ncbi:MAG TPA: glycosyltransferase family 1 protein [Candidatus Accumulibacter phosphatis]|nr:glycosyltransferase family 1 protein [Candidatus Accumulibacter phosphatis]